MWVEVFHWFMFVTQLFMIGTVGWYKGRSEGRIAGRAEVLAEVVTCLNRLTEQFERLGERLDREWDEFDDLDEFDDDDDDDAGEEWKHQGA